MPKICVRRLGWRYSRAKSNALQDVTLTLEDGESLAIIGASGSGKTTLARLILALLPSPPGTVLVDGEDVALLTATRRKEFRKVVQYIPQDTLAALNPRYNVFAALAEPLRVHRLCARREIERVVHSLLDEVGLAHTVLTKRPHELSGGMRQRVVVARALSFQPQVLVADEPTSSVDALRAAQVMKFLAGLRGTRQLLLISHQLNSLAAVVDRVVVLHNGRVVDRFAAGVLVSDPAPEFSHPITRRLFTAFAGR